MIDTLTLTPIAVPRTSDGPDARDFVAAAEVLNRPCLLYTSPSPRDRG